MNANVTVLERAFELARSGRCRTIDDIHRQLKAEGYSTHQIMGPWLHRQLRSLMQDATHGLPADVTLPRPIHTDSAQE